MTVDFRFVHTVLCEKNGDAFSRISARLGSGRSVGHADDAIGTCELGKVESMATVWIPEPVDDRIMESKSLTLGVFRAVCKVVTWQSSSVRV